MNNLKNLNKAINDSIKTVANENIKMYKIIVGPLGFEPKLIEPKSIVLPLHHGPK